MVFRSRTKICQTDDCARHVALLTESLNYSVNPCDDFGAYVCSAWRPRRTIFDAPASQLGDVVTSWFEHLDALLSDGSRFVTVARKPLALLRACESYRSILEPSPSATAAFRDFLVYLGLSWPERPPADVDALGVLLSLVYKWDLCFWLHVTLLPAKTPERKERLAMSHGSAARVRRFIREHHRLVADGTYAAHLKAHLALLATDDHNVTSWANDKVASFAAAQGMIGDALLEVVNKQIAVPELVSFSDLGNTTGRLNSSEWLTSVSNIVKTTAKFVDSDMVLVKDASVLRFISTVFDAFDNPELVFHLSWQFVRTYAGVVDWSLRQDTYDFGRPTLFCPEDVDRVFQPLIVALYSHLKTTKEERKRIDANLKGIVSWVVERIAEMPLSHLNGAGRHPALFMLESLRVRAWPAVALLRDISEIYASFPDDESSSFVELWIQSRRCLQGLVDSPFRTVLSPYKHGQLPLLVSYDYLANKVDVGMAALNSPLYYKNATKATFYGGLGFLFASELIKLVESTGNGLRPERIGGAGQAVFHPQVAATQGRQTGCGNGSHLLPHLPALEAAYGALYEDTKTSALQISANLTEPQVFFMTMCRTMCGNPGWHSLSTADCNSLVQNSAAFANAFACPSGSRMNPASKCRFFAKM
ncbi:hypothetical protein V5799_014641 [Amblyomma americanum]|uniref:M13 family peptidase n=1 Tax=Amblyomma americanum TaxID=6943 RepID=A0AAQ4E2G1_AMBAM